MNTRLVDQYRFIDRRDRVERFVFDFNQVHRIERDVFVNCSNRRDGSPMNRTFSMPVHARPAHGQDAVRNRKVFSGNYSEYAGQGERF